MNPDAQVFSLRTHSSRSCPAPASRQVACAPICAKQPSPWAHRCSTRPQLWPSINGAVPPVPPLPPIPPDAPCPATPPAPPLVPGIPAVFGVPKTAPSDGALTRASPLAGWRPTNPPPPIGSGGNESSDSTQPLAANAAQISALTTCALKIPASGRAKTQTRSLAESQEIGPELGPRERGNAPSRPPRMPLRSERNRLQMPTADAQVPPRPG